MYWSQPQIVGGSIESRYHHAAVSLPTNDPTESHPIIILGGLAFGLLEMNLFILADQQQEQQQQMSHNTKQQQQIQQQGMNAGWNDSNPLIAGETVQFGGNTKINNLERVSQAQQQQFQQQQPSQQEDRRRTNEKQFGGAESYNNNNNNNRNTSMNQTGISNKSNNNNNNWQDYQNNNGNQQNLQRNGQNASMNNNNNNSNSNSNNSSALAVSDFESRIDQLQALILEEKLLKSTMEKEMQEMEETLREASEKSTRSIQHVAQISSQEIELLDEEYKRTVDTCMQMFLLVKEEEEYIKSVSATQVKLEQLLQAQTAYTITVDQLFLSIVQQGEEREPQSEEEFMLLEMLRSQSENLAVQKEEQKQNFMELRSKYAQISDKTSQLNDRIHLVKAEIQRENQQFQPILETEADMQ